MKTIAFALLLAAAVAAATVLVVQRREYTWEVAAAVSPSKNRIAFVRGESCGPVPCQSLWIGASRDDATRVARLAPGSEECDEIVWTPDGKRVAFLINGHQLHLYNGETLSPAGLVKLIQGDASAPDRIARGVTFSENGRAVTFDDCPRSQSGCRASFAGIPQ